MDRASDFYSLSWAFESLTGCQPEMAYNNKGKKTMSTDRAFTYLKSEIRRIARTNGVVSAVDVRNVMRTHLDGDSRGAFVRNAFTALISEGFLAPTSVTTRNPDNRHQVTVYRTVSW